MEKPWMPGLLEALQAPPTKERPSEPPSARGPLPDYFAGETGAPPAPLTKEPEPANPGFEEPASEPPAASPSFSQIFAGGSDGRWSPTTKSPLEYDGSSSWNESWWDRILTHIPAITIVVLFVAAIGALSFFYRVQFGQSLVRLGEKISGESAQTSATSALSATNTSASALQPASSPLQSAAAQPPSVSSSSLSPSVAHTNAGASPSADLPKNLAAFPNASSTAGAASVERDHSAPSAAKNSSPQIPAAVASAQESGQADFRVAEASLRDAHTPEAKAKAAELLWTAVSNGSSDAEVELADAYARGDGVRKNCQQARILLDAAIDKHNPLAARESAELQSNGCR